jgi:hypothetical protein
VDFRQSQRALDFMRGVLPEQRRCSRLHLPARAVAVFPSAGSEQQNVVVRDINMLGAFFYCKQTPREIGDRVVLDLILTEQGSPMQVRCGGVVMRIERPAPAAAVGVAVQFTTCELLKTPYFQPTNEISFVRWSLEMVEHMFARRPELQRWASKIQGAA